MDIPHYNINALHTEWIPPHPYYCMRATKPFCEPKQSIHQDCLAPFNGAYNMPRVILSYIDVFLRDFGCNSANTQSH